MQSHPTLITELKHTAASETVHHNKVIALPLRALVNLEPVLREGEINGVFIENGTGEEERKMKLEYAINIKIKDLCYGFPHNFKHNRKKTRMACFRGI